MIPSKGFINLYKPPSMTSFDCVREIRKIFVGKVGHLGTLDPMAEGVLPIAFGKATKLIEYVQGGTKVYKTTFLLGTVTDTDDIEGNILFQNPPPKIPLDKIKEALCEFVGEIYQTPPKVSAVRIQGKRAYELFRKGEEVNITPRKVKIYSIEVIRFNPPYISLLIKCSRGTYIRSIARDLGEKLGCGATVYTLCRVESGVFRLENSIKLEEIYQRVEREDFSFVLKPEDIMTNFPHIRVNEAGKERVLKGAYIQNNNIIEWKGEGKVLAIFDFQGTLIGMGKKEKSQIHPVKVIS